MPVNDFGYVALDILWTYPEDGGLYTCRATNKHGSDETMAHIKCYGTCTAIDVIVLCGKRKLLYNAFRLHSKDFISDKRGVVLLHWCGSCDVDAYAMTSSYGGVF